MSLTELVKSSSDPVDPELYLWCHGVYQAAAQMTMPVENPGARPLFADGDKTYSFSDIPMNRGMLAVMKELRERGQTQAQSMAMTSRLMHFGELLTNKKLKAFVKPGEDGGLLVSEALIKACATARLIITKKRFSFVVADVARIAQQITDEEEAIEAAKTEKAA